MRGFLFLAAVTMAALPAQAEDVWSAACYGQNNFQYIQTIGGAGYVHFPNGDGSFSSVKLKQVYYNGNVVCGATVTKPGPKDIGGICADNQNQKVRIEYGVQISHGVRPADVATYCDAQVTVTKSDQ